MRDKRFRPAVGVVQRKTLPLVKHIADRHIASVEDSAVEPAVLSDLKTGRSEQLLPLVYDELRKLFEINVGALSAADRDAFLAALAAGNATVAIKNDAPGSVYQAFAVCQVGQTHADDCVAISQPDANHVVFQGATGHFSTFAVVTVSGSSTSSPPVAHDDVALLSAGTSVTINVLANDSDANGDALTVTAVTQPASGRGTVTINANGTLTYMQTVLASGAETFTYTISDAHGGTATAAVTVSVNLPAKTGIDLLLAQVKSSSLRHGQQTSLIAKLNAAQKSLTKGNTRAAATN